MSSKSDIGKRVRDRILSLNLNAAALCDADKAFNLNDLETERKRELKLRVLSSQILQPISSNTSDQKMAGLAHTVQLTAKNDMLGVLRGLHGASEGDILFVHALDSTKAVAGGLFAAEAARRNLAGVVIYGPCRDVAEIQAAGVPFYARYSTPWSGGVVSPGETCVPLTVEGVKVNHGDFVYGDGDGIVIGKSEHFEELLSIAEIICKVEANLADGMRGGKALHSMMNFEEHLKECIRGNDANSVLMFDDSVFPKS